jgi:hypothetical protein
MAKVVKNLVKKLSSAYMKGFYQMYGPCINAGINPFI